MMSNLPTSIAVMHLPDRLLFAARLVWIAVSILSGVVFIAGLMLGGGAGAPVGAEMLRRVGVSASFVKTFQQVRVIGFVFAYVLVGVLIFWRKSNERMAFVTSLMLVTMGVTGYLNVPLALAAVYPAWQAPVLALAALAYTLSGFVFYTFPDGRFNPHWTWALLPLWSAWNISHLVPALPAGAARTFNQLDPFLGVFFLGLFIAIQAYRYRRIYDAVQRQQTKWVVLGAGAALCLFAVFRLSPWPGDPAAAPLFRELVLVTGGTLALMLVPVSIGFAILRYRLWDIDFFINRTLVYGALSAATIALYVVLVSAVSSIFSSPEAARITSFLATGAVAVLFEPLRERLQRVVNRLMYGEGDDPATVLARFSRRLEASVAPDAMLEAITETVVSSLRLPYAAIAIQESGGNRRIVAQAGAPVEPLMPVPLAYQGEPVGELLLAPRARGELLSTADQRLLAIIAQQAGTAAHTVRLAAELRQLNDALVHSRQRLVTAQEEERRRLRRDLHDGVGPTLASLSHRLDAAADLVTQDPQASKALLGELKARVKDTVAEIRRIVYALRPPVLDEFGLVSAIREHAAPYAGPNGLNVIVQADEPLPLLPAAVEVAAYRIALEAITNVVQHAHASACRISLKLEGDSFWLEVTDDGRGTLPDMRPGVGLASMRERAAELGGECSFENLSTGGVRIWARLPVAKD